MIKTLVPKSLFARFILIIMIPTILTQIVATYFFYYRHWDTVTRHMIDSLSGEIAAIVKLHNSEYGENIFSALEHELPLIVKTSKNIQFDLYNPKLNSSLLNELYLSLTEKIHLPINMNSNETTIEIFVKTPRDIVVIEVPRKRVENSTTYIFILWMTGTATFFFIVAVIFSKNQIRPIIKLVRALEQFGKGQKVSKLAPEGALEIRKVANAFVKMKDRIEKQITQRTEMLNCISHDLRTPLTRIKLRIAMSKDKNTKSMEKDVNEMIQMINSYLEFARGEGTEQSSQISIKKLLEEIVANYQLYQKYIKLNMNHDLNLTIKYEAFKRSINNIINNSFDYGDKVEVNCYKRNDFCIIEIEDNGIGIDENEYENVFKPFYRTDDSRNKENRSGVGLGLAITKDIITNHGGNIKLSKSKKLGGLLSIITIPI